MDVSDDDKNNFQNKKKQKKVNKKKIHKRKNSEGYSEESNISQNKSHTNKKTKKGNSSKIMSKAKWLHKEKKKAISELNELQDILGVTSKRDVEENELERFIFGCDAEELQNESSSSSSEEEKEEEKDKVTEDNTHKKPAWEDEDDDDILIEDKIKELKNCHRSITSRNEEKLSEFVKEQFKKIVGNPKWAKIGRLESSDDDSGDELLQKTGNFTEKSKSLPKGSIQMQKCPSLVDKNTKNAIIKSVEFHPASRVAVVAGTDGTANLFQIDGKINAKIQSVHFKKFPIHAAHFSADGKELFVGSNMYGDFYSYDMMSGNIIFMPFDKGMEQRNVRRFEVSPNGKYIVIHGRYGYIHLVTTDSKEWIGSLKMNGEVIATTFNKNGSMIYSHGENGEIYVWDLKTRKCMHKFVDQGCITGTSLALSPNEQFLAAGSDVGVVNIYDNNTLFQSKSPQPVKILMNLTTEVTQLKFNCTSELLAMSSSHKQNAVKLVHFPSMSVFQNFPVNDDQSKLNYINSLDISLNSGYLCLGNNMSTAHVFRLKHYGNY